jgi:hypothetical protein
MGFVGRLKSVLPDKVVKVSHGVLAVVVIFLFALLIDLALPLFIVMPVLIAPFGLILFIIEKERRTPQHLLNILRIIVLGPLFIGGFCAPIRAIFEALGIEPSPLIVNFCPWVLPWYDIGIGAVGTIFGIWGGFFLVFSTFRQSRLVENLPISKARSAALGLSGFHGVARSVEKKQLFKEKVENGKPFMEIWDGAPKDRIILLGKWWVPDNSEQRGWSPARQKIWSRFYLEDDSGRILVDPIGVDIDQMPGGEVRSIILSRQPTSTTHEENFGNFWTLMPGDPVYLIGSVEVNEEAPLDSTGSDRLVIRPSTRLSQTNFLRRLILGSAKWLAGKDVQDIFLLTDTDEIGATNILRKGIKSWIILAIIWTVSSFWLFSHSAPWFK